METATEVPRSGGVGDSFGSQSVEIGFVVAPQLDVFDPLTASDDVEGNIQDVVGFMIGRWTLRR
jgi:hypothetical protein